MSSRVKFNADSSFLLLFPLHTHPAYHGDKQTNISHVKREVWIILSERCVYSVMMGIPGKDGTEEKDKWIQTSSSTLCHDLVTSDCYIEIA